jgi:hypothetical protein
MAKQKRLAMHRLPASHLQLLILGMIAADQHEAICTGTDNSSTDDLYDLLKVYCSKRRYLNVLRELEAKGQITVRQGCSGRRVVSIASNAENILQLRALTNGNLPGYVN